MSQFGLLEKVIQILSERNIPYMLTGSIVSSLQGIPRSTHDIDIIVSVDKTFIHKITEAFPKQDYYINEKSIEAAINNKDQFNIIDINQGDKIDFWILTDSEYDKSRFSRKQKVKFLNFEIYVSAPEDTIVQKLYWSRQSGGSRKHFDDALNIFEVQYGNLDVNYMVLWSRKLGIESLFKELKRKADFIE